MTRALCPVAAVAAALAVGAAFSIAGCAVGEPPDLTPGAAPGLPAVDAAFDPAPALGTDGADAGFDATSADAAASSDAPLDAKSLAPSAPTAKQGDILVTEVMYNPSGSEPRAEWFELTNTASAPRSLGGIVITDGGGRTHVIAPGTIVAPGAYVLFVRDKATAIAQKVPASAILYEYGTGLSDTAGILLLNGATGTLTLADGATEIAHAPYGPWFTQSGGKSVQLDVLAYGASASGTSWCLSPLPWATGSDMGTPGAASNCP